MRGAGDRGGPAVVVVGPAAAAGRDAAEARDAGARGAAAGARRRAARRRHTLRLQLCRTGEKLQQGGLLFPYTGTCNQINFDTLRNPFYRKIHITLYCLTKKFIMALFCNGSRKKDKTFQWIF